MVNYTSLPGDAVIRRTVHALKNHTNIEATVAQDRKQALDMLVARVPEGAHIYPGTSATLEAIGYVDYLAKNPERYRNLRLIINKEPDTTKRAVLRRGASIDYFIGSVHAVAETGEVVTASQTGSQLAEYANRAQHVIWVIGAQKITPNLETAIRRVREHSLPLEEQRVRRTGGQGSHIGKLLIVEHERQDGRIFAIIVGEALGF